MLSRYHRGHLGGYLVAVVAASLTTAVIAALNHYVSIPNISLLYLPSILATAVYFGTRPSLTAATLAALEYDFFLLRPAFTFSIAQAQDILAFTVFVLVAVISSQLAAGAKARTEAARRQAVESATLYDLAQALITGYDLNPVLDAITRRIVEVFDVSLCAIFIPDPSGQLEVAGEAARGIVRRDRASHAAATWAFQKGTQLGLPVSGSDGDSPHRLYLPLQTTEQVVGVMEVGPKRTGESLSTQDYHLVASFAAQAALVIIRARAEEERQRLKVLEETDRLKSALLSSVSHDLRTPLSAIKASATSLLLPDAAWTREEGREFLRTIDQEADRLNRLVGNLLDLSRIQAGALHPVLDWYDMHELIESVLPRLRLLAGDRPFSLEVQPDIPAVRLDLLRIEELLSNLVENAVKYTPPASPITLRIWHESSGLRIAVADHGPGVPKGQRRRIFETFYRGQPHSDRNPGTGLGLAICRGVAEVHGGTLHVEDTPGGGATFVLTLPPSLIDQGVTA